MQHTELNPEEYTIEIEHANRGVHSRIVYKHKLDKNYLKLWGEDYYYRKHFESAYKAGFFKDITLLEDVVNYDDIIIGYITKTGNPVNFDNFDKYKFLNLTERLADRCLFMEYVYIDYSIKNLVEFDGKYYIIDLEPTIKANQLREIQGIEVILEHNDLNYRNQIKSLLTEFTDDKIKIVRQHTKWDKEIKFGTANGRIFLEEQYLPTLGGRTLFVGVNYYTDFYHLLVQTPELFETLDVMESVVEHGSPNVHYICNILDFKNQGYLYDNVCFFGIIGHPDDWDIIKQKEEIIKCIEVLDSLVKVGGTLLLGPATVTTGNEFWEEIYDLPILKKRYDIKMYKKIDINYIWYGHKLTDKEIQ